MQKGEYVIEIKKLVNTDLPRYAFESDVGFDLRAAETVYLEPYEQKTLKTGIALKIPKGCVGLIRDRAGIITKMGIHTAAGTFDPDYRGEISVVLINFGEQAVEIEKGMRIAQIIILPVIKAKIKEVKNLDKTERHDKGFGSTGIKEFKNKTRKKRKK